MNNILIYSVGDWAALFVNGEMVGQDHNFYPEDIAEFCPIEPIITEYASTSSAAKFAAAYGRFPTGLSYEEIKELKLED